MTTSQRRQRDVVDLLLGQHKEIQRLFGKLAKARGTQKRQAFEDLVRLLAVHETAEEELVHPLARTKIPNGKRVIDARLKEEDSAKRTLAELYDLGVDHPDFDARLAALATEVLEHAAKEERLEFPQLRDRLDEPERRRMALMVQAAEAVAPTRPHPEVGESVTANLLAGPALAIFDRARDAVRDWRKSH